MLVRSEDLENSVTLKDLDVRFVELSPSVSSTVLCRPTVLKSSNDGPESRCGSDGGEAEPSGFILFANFISQYSSSGRLKG